jgi:hypothetical protein
MKMTNRLAFQVARVERSLEATLFAATTVVVTGGIVAIFVRLAFGLA